MKAKEEACTCGCHGVCPSCMGLKMFVLGVLILLNVYYVWFSWPVFIGGVIALAGLLKVLIPTCMHCKDKK